MSGHIACVVRKQREMRNQRGMLSSTPTHRMVLPTVRCSSHFSEPDLDSPLQTCPEASLINNSNPRNCHSVLTITLSYDPMVD